MFSRTFKVTVPAGATSVQLPIGVDRDATLEITNITNPEHPSQTKRLADGTIAITAQAYARTLQIGVTQDNPLIATHGAVPDWTPQTEYFKNELVMWKGRIYRCKSDVVKNGAGWTLSYPYVGQWENTAGDTGLICDFMSFQNPTPDGYWPLDGTTINAPWSPLHGAVTPNLIGRVLSTAGNGNNYGASGQESVTLASGHLPRGAFPVSVGFSSAGTPTGSVSIGSAGYHSHTLYSCGSGTGSYIDHDTSGSSYNLQSYSSSIGGAGDHSHGASFSGNPLDGHSHSASVTLNTAASQDTISLRQPTFAIYRFVRL